MNAPNLTPENEALLTRWHDGSLLPTEEPALEALFAQHPELASQRAQWHQLRALIQAELPRELEPPSPDFFTSQIMRELAVQPATAIKKQPWWLVLRSAWIAPMAATAAVLAVGMMLNNKNSRTDLAAAPYSPDPSVKATLAFHSEANATILDLENLQMADATEIRPFSVASSSGPGYPGMAQSFYAANDPSKVVFTMGWDGSTRPIILDRL